MRPWGPAAAQGRPGGRRPAEGIPLRARRGPPKTLISASSSASGSARRAGLGDLFGQFRRAGSRAASSSRRRGADIAHELEIPFNTSIVGGEVQLNVQRPQGKSETLMVKIPAGIAEGKKIRIRGHGEPAAGKGPPGDILITIHVAPHPYFTRKGNHLYVRLPLTLGEAADGAKIDVPTPTGAVTLTIPPGASTGTKFRIKGHGVAAAGGARRRPVCRGANRDAEETGPGRSSSSCGSSTNVIRRTPAATCGGEGKRLP